MSVRALSLIVDKPLQASLRAPAREKEVIVLKMRKARFQSCPPIAIGGSELLLCEY